MKLEKKWVIRDDIFEIRHEYILFCPRSKDYYRFDIEYEGDDTKDILVNIEKEYFFETEDEAIDAFLKYVPIGKEIESLINRTERSVKDYEEYKKILMNKLKMKWTINESTNTIDYKRSSEITTKYIFDSEEEAMSSLIVYLAEKESLLKSEIENYNQIKLKAYESLKKTSQ